MGDDIINPATMTNCPCHRRNPGTNCAETWVLTGPKTLDAKETHEAIVTLRNVFLIERERSWSFEMLAAPCKNALGR